MTAADGAGSGPADRSEASSADHPRGSVKLILSQGLSTYLPTSALGGSTHAADRRSAVAPPWSRPRRRRGALLRAVGPHPGRGGRGGAGRGHGPVRRRRRPRRAVQAAHRVDAGRGRAVRRSWSRSRSPTTGRTSTVVAGGLGRRDRRGGGPAHLAGVRRGVLRLRPGLRLPHRGQPRRTREPHVPRRDAPRPGAGRLGGLAGPWTGIYPTASPGGWQLLGTTETSLWDQSPRAAGAAAARAPRELPRRDDA